MSWIQNLPREIWVVRAQRHREPLIAKDHHWLGKFGEPVRFVQADDLDELLSTLEEAALAIDALVSTQEQKGLGLLGELMGPATASKLRETLSKRGRGP